MNGNGVRLAANKWEFLQKRPYLLGIFIILLILVIYLPTMNTYLMSDDFEWLDSVYLTWKNPTQLFELINNFFRPTVKFTYLLNYTLFKTNAVFYNIFTVLLHLLNIFLLYHLIFKITRRITPAALISLTYGVSPLYTEVTLWSAGRTESTLLIFMLGVLILLNGIEEKKQGFRRVMIILFTLLAAGAKETWVLLPFLAFGFLWIVKRIPFKKALTSTLSLFLLLGVYLVYFIGVPILTGKAPPTSYANLDIQNAINKFGYMICKYVGLGDMFYGEIWQFVLLVVVLAGLGYWLIRRKNWLALYGYLWMLITIGISLPIYYAPARYHYIPLVGFWIMIVAFLEEEIIRLVKRFNIKKSLVFLAIGIVLGFHVAYQAVMMQWEIKDYRLRGSLHKPLVDMYLQVKDQLAVDQPIVFIDLGTRKAVFELARSIRGYQKLLFVREKAIWQQVFLAPLANFLGDPFSRLMIPIPKTGMDALMKGNFTTLVFNDKEFFIPTSREYEQKVRDYFRQYRQLPSKVQVLRFVPVRDIHVTMESTMDTKDTRWIKGKKGAKRGEKK
jgi:hypothetical protein